MRTLRSRFAGLGREDGQMLVVFAGGLVLLLAIAALVVDLGFVFMLRRQEQNAADPGALAAARYIPSADRAAMWTAACFYAKENGFMPTRTDTNGGCFGSADSSTITVNYPPSKAAVEYAGNPSYVEVTISQPHRSFFAGVIGMPSIAVVSAAVAANDTGTAGTSSLIALAPTGCSTGKLHGGGSGGGVDIFPAAGVDPDAGGYVQVNSDCGTAYGANDNCTDGPSGALTIAGGTYIHSNTIYIQGSCNVNGASATINATTEERASYVGDPLALVRPPSPADLPTQACPGAAKSGTPTAPRTCNVNGTQTLNPGTYYGGWNIGKGTVLTLNPGIYILAGGGITQTGGILAASGRVLIYGTDSPVCGTGGGASAACQQELNFGGSATLNLRGLDATAPCPPYGATGCPYGGLLMWQDAHASGAGTANADINLEGTGSLYLEGTIYSAAGDVTITGNGLGTGCTPDASGNTNCAAVQVIANTFDVGGAGVLAMPYDPNKFYKLALKGLVR